MTQPSAFTAPQKSVRRAAAFTFFAIIAAYGCAGQQRAPKPGNAAASAGSRTMVVHVGGMMKSKSGAT